MSTPELEPQIKGAAMQETIRFVSERFGADAHDRELAALRREPGSSR